ncbi:M20 metallopeptidase family protein [Tessaracoccus antarcticus]|uniref:M20 metallopeptidase family protein n=1 Tax=Tessaracoccus antarcticus TaxID=2479848 RepID=UPI001F21BE7C|nr:M20 family metallopeptidase [Tessaracoccus antarcticus]
MTTQDFLQSINGELVALRRDLHQIPEVGLDLPQTQARILQALDGLPLEITLGKSVSSVVGILRGGRQSEGKRDVVLLRGDMDALPVEELTGLDYASTNGNMHACGHDLHMSLLVGAARALCEMKDDLAGDVIFMFQPGEEGVDGCRYMLEEGLLDIAGPRPTAAYAIHVWSSLDPLGTFSTKPGPVMASSDVARVRVVGRGGHGSAPHLAKDPVPALAEMVTATHSLVTRGFDVFDPVVVTVGRLSAGTIANVIPEEGSFDATLRTFSDAAHTTLLAELPKMVDGIAAAHGVTAHYDLLEQYPVTVNDADHADLVAETATRLFGEDRHLRWKAPLAGAEDFSRILEEVPGCFIGLSACPADLDPATAPFNHSAYARFDDAVVADGALLLADLAATHLSPGA